MTGNINVSTNIISRTETVYFIDESCITTNLIGYYYGYVNNCKIILHDVLYSSKFKINFISIDHICDDGCKIIF